MLVEYPTLCAFYRVEKRYSTLLKKKCYHHATLKTNILKFLCCKQFSDVDCYCKLVK